MSVFTWAQIILPVLIFAVVILLVEYENMMIHWVKVVYAVRLSWV